MANPRNKNLEPISEIDRKRILRPTGKLVWHGVTPTRFYTANPHATGPVLQRPVKDQPNTPAMDPWGAPQLPSREAPPGH
jgi:hypothetical protein